MSELQRHTWKREAMNCRAGICKACDAAKAKGHPKEDHGIRSEYWYLSVKTEQGALELEVSTPFYHPTVDKSSWTDGYGSKFEGYALRYHSAWACGRGSVGDTPEECHLLGQCYAIGSGRLLRGEELVDMHFDTEAGIDAQPETLWQALAAQFDRDLTEATNTRTDEHWERCPRCNEGILDK